MTEKQNSKLGQNQRLVSESNIVTACGVSHDSLSGLLLSLKMKSTTRVLYVETSILEKQAPSRVDFCATLSSKLHSVATSSKLVN